MREYFIWLLKLITLFVLFAVAIPVLIGVAVSISSQGGPEMIVSEGNTVAVVELTGVIDSSKEILEELHKHIKNDKVKGIVLRIDSPGGAVAPSQDIFSSVRKLKDVKPIVASMGSVAASGGLYAALGASKVYAQPGTLTGSIGVILELPNLTKVAENFGVEMITIKSGKLKDVGNMFRAMTDEERAFLEATASSAHQDFIQAVVEGRALPKDDVLNFADGRVILGSEAKRLKLIDEFGDVYDAARAVFDLLGTPLKAGEVPKLKYKRDKYERIFELLEESLRIFTPATLRAAVVRPIDVRYQLY